MIKKDEEILKKLYKEVNESMITKNTGNLRNILKPNTVLIHMTGYVQPINDWLRQIDNEEMKYYSWEEETIKHLKINGDRASLVGQSLVKARIGGNGPTIWPLQIKMSFEKTNDVWYVSKQVASIY